MKKIVIIGLFSLLLCLAVVSAGNSTEVSFDTYKSQGVYLYEHDEVRFSLLGDEHVIIVEDVGKSSVKLDIGAFIGNSTKMFPGLVGMDYINKVDLDKDGITDLNVALYSIDADGRIMLVLQDVTDESLDEITGNIGLVDSNPDMDGFNKNYLLIGLGVIVLGLVVFLVFRNKSNEELAPTEEVVTNSESEENKENF